MPSNTISITFVYKINIFANFFDKIAAKYTPKRTKLHHFLKFSPGSMPPNPPNKRVALPRPTWRFALSEIRLNPPTEILNTLMLRCI